MDKPVQLSNYTDTDSKNQKLEDHLRMVDRDLGIVMDYVQKLPQPGLTKDITIGAVVFHYKNGVLTGTTP